MRKWQVGPAGLPTFDGAQWIPASQEQVDAVVRCAEEVGPRRDDNTTVASVLDVEGSGGAQPAEALAAQVS